MIELGTMALWVALSAIAALFTFRAADRPVSRHRVQRFASRHDIEVTADNGRQIIAYLATTRRWRAAGLVGGLTAYALIDLRHNRISVNIAYLVAGWFLGALAAEVRVAGLFTGRRAASLAPRTLDLYLSRLSRRALPGSALAFLVLAAATALVADAPQGSVPP